MANTSKSKFDKYQALVAVTVPIMTAALGVFAYQADQKASDATGRIAQVESSINKVEAMGEYFKMMAGDNNAEAKMAAYALYVLTKEDQLILRREFSRQGKGRCYIGSSASPLQR